MERHFEHELEKLNKRIIKMGNLVADQVHRSLSSLISGDLETAQQIISLDKKVDRLDIKIDKLCQRIFALAQPVATDLRLIMSALKINNDLERMGDHAVSIAFKVETISEYKELLTELKITEIIELTDTIVRDVINILNTKNTELVKEIFELSGRIEEQTEKVSTRIIDEMIHKTEVIMVATQLILILTTIERLAAYSTNIAESVVFIVEGKMMKHKKRIGSEETDDPISAATPSEG